MSNNESHKWTNEMKLSVLAQSISLYVGNLQTWAPKPPKT